MGLSCSIESRNVRLILLVLLLISIIPDPATGATPARLMVHAYDVEDNPVIASVMLSGQEAGEAWSPILIDPGSYQVVVTHQESHWAGQLLLLPEESKTLQVTLGHALPMVLVQPGSFLMGSPVNEPGRQDDEHQHLVTLTRGFWMATTEVSQALYEEVMGTNPSRWVSPLRPVENVTWFDCVRFCNQLSEQHGFQQVYSITDDVVEWDPMVDGYRLPTEAEWEYSSRAGTSTMFSFGDDPDRLHQFGNYCDQACQRAWRDSTQVDGHAFTAPVGSFEPNAWGLYDMHGNLWEWCWDWWAPFEAPPLVDPQGPLSGSLKAERGGCWEVGPDMCRQAYRHYVEPDQKRSYLGFRIVRTQH